MLLHECEILVKYSVEIHVKEMKKERRKKQTNYKAKLHSTPKAVTFPKKNELPRVGIEPTTFYTLDRTFCTVHVQCILLFLHVHIYTWIYLSSGSGSAALPHLSSHF